MARRCCAARPRPRCPPLTTCATPATPSRLGHRKRRCRRSRSRCHHRHRTDDITLYAVWVANTDTPYTIERYQLNADGTITKLPNLTGTGTTGESVTTVPVAPDGYQVPTTHYITGLWDGDPNYVINERLTDIISGDGKMVLVHVFVPVSGNYVVKIYNVDGMGNAIQVDVAGNELAAGDALLEGYKHAGAVGSNVVVDATGASATAGYIYHAYASNPPARL